MAKVAKSFFFCFIVISSLTGCRIFRPRSPSPIPSTPPITEPVAQEKTEKEIAEDNKRRIKTKTEITKELDSLRGELRKIEVTFANKRAGGIDTGQPEKTWENSGNLLKEAERLYLEANLTENYEPVLGLLQAINDSLKKIEEELKKAPRFRDVTKPQPREYLDDRDIIFAKIGSANPVRTKIGPMISFSFRITDPTGFLSRDCFDGRDFHLSSPPKVMIVEFNKGQEGLYQFVLIEENFYINRFSLKSSLSPEQRDQALSMLCLSQGSSFESYRFLAAYKNAPTVSPEFYLEQLLSGQFRFADQFGLQMVSNNASGGAGLADLELVSLVFSTKISPLSQAQYDTLGQIQEKIKSELDMPNAENLKKAFAKIVSWQNTMSPRRNDKNDFLRLLRSHPDEAEIESLVNNFENYLKQLAEEFNRVQKELLRFKKDYDNELAFYDDESPVMFLLLRGVGFRVEEESAKTLFKKDIPQLLVEFDVLYFRSKNDEDPLLVGKDQYKIENANKYIDVSKDYQRLTSFMLGWPLRKTLPSGYFQLKFTITDEIREKAIIQQINFTVLPASSKQK